MVYNKKKDKVADETRIAVIIRKLENCQDSYADSSTFVMTETMRQNSKVALDMEHLQLHH
jgi:hypothetical protein